MCFFLRANNESFQVYLHKNQFFTNCVSRARHNYDVQNIVVIIINIIASKYWSGKKSTHTQAQRRKASKYGTCAHVWPQKKLERQSSDQTHSVWKYTAAAVKWKTQTKRNKIVDDAVNSINLISRSLEFISCSATNGTTTILKIVNESHSPQGNARNGYYGRHYDVIDVTTHFSTKLRWGSWWMMAEKLNPKQAKL